MSDFKQRLESATPHHQRRPPQRGRWHRQKDKNRSPSRKTNLQKSDYPKTRTKRDPNVLCVVECDNLYLCQITNNQCIMLIIGGREISRPYPNVGYRLEKFDAVFYQEIMLSSGVFRRETASGFLSLGQRGRPSWEGGGGIVWLAAWKLVSNDAKRTIPPPNAKHSTLLQGCFLCFCFLFHSRFCNNA